jgi:hypothetical protein
MIEDTKGARFLFYAPDRHTYDWEHMNRFHMRARNLDSLREHLGRKMDRGRTCYWGNAISVWVAADTPDGIRESNCDALEMCMPYTVHTTTDLNGVTSHEDYMEWAAFLERAAEMVTWLESDPEIMGKPLSRRLGEDLVGAWRSKQARTQADLEARVEDPAFGPAHAKSLIKQLKQKALNGSTSFAVIGRDGTHYRYKTYMVHAELDSVWNKAKCAFIPRIFLRWDKSWGSKTSQADIIAKLTTVVSRAKTTELWDQRNESWV